MLDSSIKNWKFLSHWQQVLQENTTVSYEKYQQLPQRFPDVVHVDQTPQKNRNFHQSITKKRATYGKAPNPRLRMQYLMVPKDVPTKVALNYLPSTPIHPPLKLRAHTRK